MPLTRSFLVSVFLLLSSSAWSQNIRQICEDQGLSGAALGNCLVDEAARQVTKLDGLMCSKSRCYLVLNCSGADRDRVCQGEGFEITFRSEEWGTMTIVKDPDGSISEFGRCGTCTDYEYSSGPINSIELIRLGSDRDDVYFSFAK